MPVTPTRAAESAADTDAVYGMFASRSVTEHVLRGVLGLALAVAALVYAGDHPWALLGLLGTAVLWRGCPTCWAMGLAATIAGRRRTCADGICR